MTIRGELIDELLKEYPHPQEVLAEEGLLKQLTKAGTRALPGNGTGHAPGLRQTGAPRPCQRQHPQRHEPENGQGRARPARAGRAARPAGQL